MHSFKERQTVRHMASELIHEGYEAPVVVDHEMPHLLGVVFVDGKKPFDGLITVEDSAEHIDQVGLNQRGHCELPGAETRKPFRCSGPNKP
jgi:hypothetical protein